MYILSGIAALAIIAFVGMIITSRKRGNNMKKIISILLILVFVLALVGCGNKTDDKNYERIVELESQLAKIVENVAKLEDTVIDLKDQLNTRAETEEVTTEKTENPTETETVTETETTEENKFDGTVLETSEYTITITDYKIIQPGEMVTNTEMYQ